MLKSSVLKTSIVLSLILGLVILFVVAFLYLPNQKNLLMRGLFERTELTAAFYAPQLTRAILAHDDITTMNLLNQIVSDATYLYARLIDPQARVLAHNKISEWGKQLTGDLSKNIVISEKPLWQIRRAPDGYDYSQPLYNQSGEKLGYLSLGVSLEKIKLQEDEIRSQAIYWVVGLWVLGTVLIVVFLNLFVRQPLHRLHLVMESALLGRAGEKIDFKQPDEFGALARVANDLLQKINKQGEATEEKIMAIRQNSQSLIQALSLVNPLALIVTDSDNNIIYLNTLAAEMFGVKPEELLGHHLLELIKTTEIIAAIKQVTNRAVSRGGVECEQIYSGALKRDIRLAVAVSQADKSFLGMVLSFSPRG